MSIEKPEGFDGNKFTEKYGYTPEGVGGKITNAPEGVESLDDCVTTDEEIGARIVEEMWTKYHAVESRNVGPSAAIAIGQWAAAGAPMAVACIAWINEHYAECRDKAAQIMAGDLELDTEPSRKWKPYSYEEMLAAYGDPLA